MEQTFFKDAASCRLRARPSAGRCARGVGLLELLTVLTIVAVLAAAATPSFQGLRASAAATAASNALLTTLHHARGVALMRGVPAVVCLSADGSQCLAGDAGAANGWIEFQNDRSESPPQRDAAEPLVGSQRFTSELKIRGSRNAISYWPVSRAGTTVTFTVCAGRPALAARAVIVSQSGRPRSKLLTPREAGCDA